MAMSLLDPLFTSGAVRAVFSDEQRLQRMLDFEAALAKACAHVGVIPAAAAAAIAGRCRWELFDRAALAEEATRAGNLAIPMVKQLTRLVRETDSAAAGYVHWGATSQDAIDTGLVLQLRDEFAAIEADMSDLCRSLALLAIEYRNAPVAGRTFLQHAVPVTFGWKAAGWLDALLRHNTRLAELKRRVLVLQFGGAAGTLVSLGDRALQVSAALAEELALTLPSTSWHTNRDRVAEAACFHGLLAGTLGKIARDLSLAMQTEVAEVFEPFGEGRGGSSSMPHKRNPVMAAVVISAALRVPGLVSTMLNSMVQEHERGLGGWHAEWETLPEICIVTGGALRRMVEAVSSLEVITDKMRSNLGISSGLVHAEAISMALAEKIGREEAHALIEQASRRALEQGEHLLHVLGNTPQVMRYIDRQHLETLFNSEQSCSAAQEMIDGVLAAYRAQFPEKG
jgi:3-carboxy-cis,cis-muconate cycloisomerase